MTQNHQNHRDETVKSRSPLAASCLRNVQRETQARRTLPAPVFLLKKEEMFSGHCFRLHSRRVCHTTECRKKTKNNGVEESHQFRRLRRPERSNFERHSLPRSRDRPRNTRNAPGRSGLVAGTANSDDRIVSLRTNESGTFRRTRAPRTTGGRGSPWWTVPLIAVISPGT